MSEKKPINVDEYILYAPEYAQEKLTKIRTLLKSIAPNAMEDLKWGQPVLIEKRILFSFAAFKNYIRFMPTGPTLEKFRNELTSYNTGKDTIQFDYKSPLPIALIEKIARHRYKDVLENDAKWMY